MVIPTEANYAEWFTCSARYYLLKEGYAFLTFALGQVAHPGFPGTRLFAEGNRLVGMRFVPPVEPGPGAAVRFHRIDQAAAADAPHWALLALPDSADVLDQQLTHQKVLFARPEDLRYAEHGQACAHAGLTFKQLMAAIEQGAVGREIPGGWTHGELLAVASEWPATLYLVVNRGARIIFGLNGGSTW